MTPNEFKAPDLPPERDAEIRRERAAQSNEEKKQTYRAIARLGLRALGDGKTRPEWGSETRNAVIGHLKAAVKDPEAFLRGLTNYNDHAIMRLALEDMFMPTVMENVRSAIAQGRNPRRRRRAKGTEVRR